MLVIKKGATIYVKVRGRLIPVWPYLVFQRKLSPVNVVGMHTSGTQKLLRELKITLWPWKNAIIKVDDTALHRTTAYKFQAAVAVRIPDFENITFPSHW